MSATTLNPAHLATVRPTSNVAEAPALGGLENRMAALGRTVQKLKTPIPQAAVKANRSVQTENTSATAQQPVAAAQVDASELASAVSLRGTSERRKIETKKNNTRFFKALTNGQPGFMESHVRSMVDSVLSKTNPKSLVDLTFPSESPKQRALLKFILLEVAIASPEIYGLSQPQCEELVKARNSIYEKHGDYIEESKLAIDLAEATAPQMKMGLKQTMKAFQVLPDADIKTETSMAEFLKTVMANSNKNLTQVLIGLRNHWVNLAARDRIQYSPDISKYRQCLLNSKINQIEVALITLKGLDKIVSLCSNYFSAQPAKHS